MANLEIYKEKFAESGWRVFERAVREGQQDNINYVSVEHILIALASEKANLLHEVMHKLEISPKVIVHLLKERKAQAPRHSGEGVLISPDVISLFKLAMDRARANHRERIEANDLFIALSQNMSSPLNQVLGSFNINQDTLMEVARECAHTHEPRPPSSEVRTVRIKSGPYASFAGQVKEISEDQSTIKVVVTAFGRTITLEMNHNDVEEVTFIRR